MYRDYNILLVLYKNNWFASVNWTAEFHNAYNNVENFVANLRKLVRREAYNKFSLNEKYVHITCQDWQKKPWKKKENVS